MFVRVNLFVIFNVFWETDAGLRLQELGEELKNGGREKKKTLWSKAQKLVQMKKDLKS